MTRRQTTTSGMDWNTMLGLQQRLRRDKLYKDYLLITLGCYFGLRIGDLLSLKWVDILYKEDFTLTEQKTKKNRVITINRNVTEALIVCSTELKIKEPHILSGYIFANRWGDKMTVSYINKRLKFLSSKYQIKLKNPSSHTLRKTFGKRVFESDDRSERALVYLSEIFSHNSISTTRKYIGITQEKINNIYLNL